MPFSSTDLLGEALHVLRLRGAFYCRSELTGPWALQMPTWPDCLTLHVVVSGRAVLQLDEADDVDLRPGELVLVPHGRGHVLSSTGSIAVERVEELSHHWISDQYAILRHGGPGDMTEIVCAMVRFDHPAARSLIDLLPPVLHMRTEGGDDRDRLGRVLALVIEEANEMRPGGEAVVARLSDVLVIQAVRSWLEREPARSGWLGALTDVQVGRAVAAVHRDPTRPWTVTALARVSAMSRSAFSARFSEVVGEPAMRYVTRWRMYQAALALRDEPISVAAAADRYGYSSEAAFSRAFTRVIGRLPGEFRRTGRRDSDSMWPT